MSESTNSVNLGNARNLGLIALVVGGIATAAGATMGPDAMKSMMTSYLFAWVVLMAFTLGCLGVTLLHHTVRGSWGLSVLRLYEAGGGPWSFVAMFIAWIPIALNIHTIYHHWADPKLAAELAIQKQQWLTEPFFIGRTVFYFLIWFGLAWVLKNSSQREDKNPDPKAAQFRTNLSAPALVVFVLSVTFAITDWVMSIDPHWSSTIYGVWYTVSGALMALSFGAIVVCANRNKEPYSEIISPSLTKDLGNLCFAFTMFWCYVTLSQFLITWSGNLPEFTRYYVDRKISQHAWWNYVGAFNIVFGFFVPWTILLAPRAKAKATILLYIAVLIFFMKMVDMYWNVIPSLRSTGFDWRDIAGLVLLGGLWFTVFGSQIRQAALIPEHDTRLMEAQPHHA
ncbi:MAG: hypothetical protein K1X67_25055 [Fimbriimonadaceae bacterium]|nr:hypothetical protein [Fimbriimonadaceae bacterium]